MRQEEISAGNRTAASRGLRLVVRGCGRIFVCLPGNACVGNACCLLSDMAARQGYSVQGVADELEISTRCLRKVFSRDLGISPKTWLQQRRMVDARNLLRQGYPVVAVARILAYSHAKHLAREFVRTYGVPPGRFAARCRSGRANVS